jgi:flavin reductase (DIM6/NTAB) family NADH-FMN oxidoreductase RutF
MSILKYNIEDILSLEQRKRATLINTLSGFKSANLIGTISETGLTNLCMISSVVHVGSDPPLLGFIIRPITVTRHTYENILSTREFTINHVNTKIFKQAHQTSARYERISEFEACGLTEEFTSSGKAPFVKESHIKIRLSLAHEIPIELNGTQLLIGKITEVIIPENIFSEDGFMDIEKAETITISGLDTYHKTTKLARLSYAKPYKKLTEING